MKKRTEYDVVIVRRGIVHHKYPKSIAKARKYIGNGAESIFKTTSSQKNWSCELIWAWYE